MFSINIYISEKNSLSRDELKVRIKSNDKSRQKKTYSENKSYIIAKDGKPGPICEKLYNKLRAIQYGDEPDPYGWVSIIE